MKNTVLQYESTLNGIQAWKDLYMVIKLINNEGVAIGKTGEIIKRGNYYWAIGSIFLTLVYLSAESIVRSKYGEQ